MNVLRAAGRVALAGIFVGGGLDTLLNPRPRARLVEQAGLPRPELLARANGAVMLGAGSLLALGVLPRPAALVLLGALVPTTIVGHPFWQRKGADRQQQRLHFLKNLSTIGGLLLVLSGSSRED